KLYGSRREYERAATELVRMRHRAIAVPETPENREKKVITISVALEREGHLRVLSANRLFEQAQPQRARQMADLAKQAYAEKLRVIDDYQRTSPDPRIASSLSDTTLFFRTLLAVTDSDDDGVATAIRTLIRWLERNPE